MIIDSAHDRSGVLIENEVARVLADEVLFGKLNKGGKVSVDLAEGKLTFTYPEVLAEVPVA